jgi:Icc-related predicted phosphoesterase
LRIAATADVHAGVGAGERLSILTGNAGRDADVLVIGGDLTNHGLPEEIEVLLGALDACSIPVIATLGNHDHESGAADELSRMLTGSGIHVLDRSGVVIGGVGFVGVKGFCGGFDRHEVNSFGEAALKSFVAESVMEAEALKNGLRDLETGRRIAVLHYAPVTATLRGEPPELHAFLGASRLGHALDEGRTTLAVHGHAHHGSFAGRTPGGVPVFNVSLPVLKKEGLEQPYHVLEV